MDTDLNVQISSGFMPVPGRERLWMVLPFFFAEGGPYLLAVLFVVLWLFVDKNENINRLYSV